MDLERDLGEQPLATRMADKGLKPTDLVKASPAPITHKMVSRATKGRRLTAKTMDKVVAAYNAASGDSALARELFNYLPPPLKQRRAGADEGAAPQE